MPRGGKADFTPQNTKKQLISPKIVKFHENTNDFMKFMIFHGLGGKRARPGRRPGSREAGEAGKPGSPEAGKPGSREAEARSWISRGGGRFPKDTQMSPRGGEASKYLRVRGALPGGVTQHLRAHAQHTCCVTPPGSAPRTPKNTLST